ncbi:hypothetical protein B9G55_10630 [Saccharibacillus sp. O16]|nr:hypothetical protein B9G55_10630 [Saccharibacillus sp. O16]
MKLSSTPAAPARPFERLLAVSDVHGHGEGLDLLLKEAEYHPLRDQLILVGDYIDTDPATWRTLDRMIELTAEGAIALPGNHDLKLLSLMSAPPAREHCQRWLDWLNQLPFCAESGPFIFVHAGFRPGIPLERQSLRDITEIREEFWHAGEDDFAGTAIGGRTIVFGHTPTFKLGASPGSIWRSPGRMAIDTGAKHGVRLTLLDLTNEISYSCSTAPQRPYGDLRREHLAGLGIEDRTDTEGDSHARIGS